MPYASGLSAQLGIAAESVWGTPVTVTKFYEFLNETLQWTPTFLDGEGLHSGQAYKRDARTVISRFSVAGDVVMEHTDGQTTGAAASMGTWWKHCLGSAVTTPVQIGATTAYRQTHTPGSKAGFGLTVQVGRPQINGPTVQPFTYEGCKVASWEFSCNDNQIARLTASLLGQDEATATALATASFPAPNGVFNFRDVSVFTLGGTVTTAAGRTTIASGVSVASLVSGITISGDTGMKDDRYGFGNAGARGEPLENAQPTITGTFATEFYSRTELYDVFKANQSTPFQIDFTHGDAGSSNPYRLSFVIPALRLKSAATNVGGPDVLEQAIEWEAYDNGVDPILQVELVSKQSTSVA